MALRIKSEVLEAGIVYYLKAEHGTDFITLNSITIQDDTDYIIAHYTYLLPEDDFEVKYKDSRVFGEVV
ncbi:hypothetical protein [Staphylococcus phage vB_SsapH-Golestan-100]|nr:hypothetical protein [Staphylococcus phage vB_SsapH-Golestan-100]